MCICINREVASRTAGGRAGHPARGKAPPNASVQWQPDGLTTCSKPWFLGAGFPGAAPISLRPPALGGATRSGARASPRGLPTPGRPTTGRRGL